VHHMDVKSAFLNGDFEEVYVCQPPGFTVVGKESPKCEVGRQAGGARLHPQHVEARRLRLGTWQLPIAY
jgi:hypothetical protein